VKAYQIRQIANRISKRYGMPEVVIEKRTNEAGVKIVEVRTELPSYDGGNELIDEVSEKLGYEGENQGGCVYHFYL
jgi:hypothetical protein